MSPTKKFFKRIERGLARCNFHKVTYKGDLRLATSDGRETNYGHILATYTATT